LYFIIVNPLTQVGLLGFLYLDVFIVLVLNYVRF
jgi:hypothetical protein